MYWGFLCMCVFGLFKQYNRIVDQSVCGLKGWPWCWACGSVLRMTKDKVTFSQPQLSESSRGYRAHSGDLLCLVAFISQTLIISLFLSFSTSSLFWKLIDLRQLCFLVRTPRFKQMQIQFPACKFQLEKLAEQQWEQATEWLRNQQRVRCKEKGTKCSPFLYSQQNSNSKYENQVQKWQFYLAARPCTQMLCWSTDVGFNLVNNGPCYPQYSLELRLVSPSHEKLKMVATGWKRWGREQNKTCVLILQGL